MMVTEKQVMLAFDAMSGYEDMYHKRFVEKYDMSPEGAIKEYIAALENENDRLREENAKLSARYGVYATRTDKEIE